MFQNIVRFTLFMALIAGPAGLGVAGYQKQKPDKKGPKEKTSIYIIVQVNDDFQVMRKEEYREFQKAQAEQHKNAEKAYAEAKKAAKKEKQKFDEPKPVRPIIKPIAGQFTSREKADEQANKLRQELEEAKAKSKPKSKQ